MKLPSLWPRDQDLISGPFRSLRPMTGRLRGKNVTNLVRLGERESGTETLQKAVERSDNHDPLKAGYFR
jgi:hypothetical protein